MDEYFIIENKQPILWDSNLPAGGIVIYHVDDWIDGQYMRGYPGHPNFPAEHYKISLIQADGLYEIEKGISPGDAGDFWVEGMTLGPSDATSDGSVKWPNTDSYQSGVNIPTGLSITIKSPSRFIMTFEIKGLNNNPLITNRIANVTNRYSERDPVSTKYTVNWIISMLIGLAALIGIVVIFV